MTAPMRDPLSQVLPGFGSPGQGQPGLPGPHAQLYNGRPPEGRLHGNRDRKRKRKKRRRSALVLLLTVLLVGGGLVGAYYGLQPLVHKLAEPDDYTGAGNTPVTVKIPDGASGQRIAGVLASAGVVKTQQAFIDALKANPRAGQVQAGTYTLKKQMSAAAALTLMLDSSSIVTNVVSIPEGLRAAEVYARLSSELKLSKAALVRAAQSGKIGLPKAAGNNPEGYLFPATYSFPPDVTPAEALIEIVNRGKQEYAALGISGKQLREVIIKASIVQAEAGAQKYMGPVARVLENRLRIGMNLQLDSTISYFTGRFGITTTPAERARKSPYNTYLNRGLPVGPIGNPGQEAIAAVLRPPPGQWLFFVTVNPDTKETKFATSAAGHAKNVLEFRAWMAKNDR